METNNKTTTVHVNIDKSVIEQFEKLYPHCRKRFIENSFRSASISKELFDRIFFMDLLSHDNTSV